MKGTNRTNAQVLPSLLRRAPSADFQGRARPAKSQRKNRAGTYLGKWLHSADWATDLTLSISPALVRREWPACRASLPQAGMEPSWSRLSSRDLIRNMLISMHFRVLLNFSGCPASNCLQQHCSFTIPDRPDLCRQHMMRPLAVP